jgi:DNA-binding IclR family transcriptional regulator
VLSAFADSWDFLTLPEVARRARLSKPTAFRILATLSEEGLVFQNEANSTYGLGFLALRLADVVLGGIAIREPARPVMRAIRDAVNETVVLGILHGDKCYHIDSLEGSNMIAQSQPIGVGVPLHASTPGRALLAAMPDDDIQRYLRRMLRAAGPRSRSKLMQEIRQIRRDGYAVGAGDFMLGGQTIAVAFTDPNAAAIAVLHISFPQARFSNDLQERCIERLKDGARTIANGDWRTCAK